MFLSFRNKDRIRTNGQSLQLSSMMAQQQKLKSSIAAFVKLISSRESDCKEIFQLALGLKSILDSIKAIAVSNLGNDQQFYRSSTYNMIAKLYLDAESVFKQISSAL